MPVVDKTVELTVADLSFGGAGVGRTEDGEVVFVPFTAIGDRIAVQITEEHRRFARGQIREVLTAGPGRSEPECPHFRRCGGCVYQHLDYAAELAAKEMQLCSLLRRIGGITDIPEPEASVPSALIYGYRNKITLEPVPAEGTSDDDFLAYGYCEMDNRSFFEIHSCPLAMGSLNPLIEKIPRSGWGRKNARRPRPYSMTLRVTCDGDTHGYFGRAPAGIPWLKEALLGRQVSVPLGAFWQVNPGVAESLATTVRAWARERTTRWLVDAYAGVGTFSLAVGEDFKRRVLIESDRYTIKAAEHNHRQWGLEVHCLAGKTEEALPSAAKRLSPAETTIILDPPRAGCAKGTLAALCRIRPLRIIYVSCNGATLARDLKVLVGGGTYQMEKLALFDMFPRTAHFETAVLLVRK